MKTQTLIILSPAFPSNETDEQSPWLPAQQSLIRSINRNFPDIELIIYSFEFPKSKKLYRWNNNLVIPFGGGNQRGIANKIIWLKVFLALKNNNKQKNILGIISFWCAECCFVGSYFGRIYKLKHFCWICGQDAKKENRFVSRIRPKATELIAMSDFLMREFFENHQIRPKHLITDAIDPLLFQSPIGNRTIDIMAAGNLEKIKRYDILIAIIGEIKKHIPDVCVKICGNGSELNSVRNWIRDADLMDNIELCGLISHKAVLTMMQQTKILLHTSSYEGFGNVCLEALFAGAHVLSFVKPMDKNIDHWHIVQDSFEMLKTALCLLENKDLDHSCIFPFDMNDTAKQFIELFRLN